MSAAVSTLTYLSEMSQPPRPSPSALSTTSHASSHSNAVTNVETNSMAVWQEKANLARIRDNQRRSRARRKEYLQELEARLRQCELQGIEASAEIQLAARRVADENKKLRMLLNQNGVGDDNIKAYLQSTASPDTVMGQGFGGFGGLGSGAVQALEHLLTTRKPCCADGNTGAPGPIITNVEGGGRDSSSGSIGTVQSKWDPSYNNQVRSQNDQGGMRGSGKAPQHQFMTPSSNVSRTGSVVSAGCAGSSSAQQQQHPPRNRMPSLPPSMTSSGSTVITSSQQSQARYDFDHQVSMLPSFHGHQHHQSHNNITYLAHAHTQPHSLAPVSRSSQYTPTSASSSSIIGSNNCDFATNMITTMAGGDPQEVRADLGCLTNGIDCEVDNQLVFNVMDRYTGQGIGL
jgi:hypothetical protein